MKKFLYTFSISLFTILSATAQTEEFNTSDLRKVAKELGFEYAKRFKDVNKDKLFEMYSSLESDRSLIKQININSWAICENTNIDNFDIYNYYYKDIPRFQYRAYCKELNALMLLDGTIKQLK